MNWDGNERRKEVQSVVTLLARIEERLIAHTDKVEEHIKQDQNEFKDIKQSVGWLQKVVYMGLGGLVVVQVAVSLIK